MKRVVIALFSLTILLTAGYAFTIPAKSSDGEMIPPTLEEKFRRYGIESGIVTYKVSGVSTGTETIYFDQYGYREARYTTTTTNVFGVKSETKSLGLLFGTTQYQIDLTQNTGTKTTNPMLVSMADKDKDLVLQSERLLESMGGKKIGKKEYLGKSCDEWEVSKMASKILVWKGVALSTDATLMGLNSKMEATKFQENVEIPEEKFALPEGVKLQEIDLTGN